MAEVRLEQVRKAFGEVEVIKGVDLLIEDRAFVVFVGPSGCGKSTLLRLIAGLEDITGGLLSIGGEPVNDLPPARRGIAMVFQSYALYPHMTVFENMAFGLRLAKADRAAIERTVREAAGILQLEHLLHRKPRELSGGQRQRVAIGRAIVRQPRVFLFDEPLSNLDAALRVQMRIEIARLHRELDATMVYVTHDQVEAMTLADKIVVLNVGRVEQVGSPLDLYHRPRNRFVAGFIGSPRMNFLDSRVVERQDGAALVALPGGGRLAVPVARDSERSGGRTGEAITLGVRPEHLLEPAGGGTHAAADAVLPGEVFVVERLGAETFLHLRVAGGGSVVARAEGGTPVTVGETVEVGLRAEACHLFDADGLALDRPGPAGRGRPPLPAALRA